LIELRKAQEAAEVEKILSDPELLERIAEDGCPELSIPFDGQQCYMMIYSENKPIGVWCLYPVNGSTLNIHCNILSKHRKHGKKAGALIVNWFYRDAPDQYVKLNAEIPIIYPDVYAFTKRFGFKDEGVNRKSISKGGQIIDQWRLGLTKIEAKKFVEEEL